MNRIEKNRVNLQNWLAAKAGADCVGITDAKPLTGGAIQENWRLECQVAGGINAGLQRYVLRSDAQSVVASSLSRGQEFRVLKAVRRAGVTVPEPLWLCEDKDLIGSVFYIMAMVDGIGLGPKVAKDLTIGGDRQALGNTLGRELAKIHSIHPPQADIDFLPKPKLNPALESVAGLRKHLDDLHEFRPALEWGLRWAELNQPAEPEITMVHNDFRTGNFLLDAHGLTGILDWEFAAWGDPMTDLGWFCAKCWRFSRPDLEGGGITSREAFYEGYQAVSGQLIDAQAVNFWEVIAHIRWAVIALQQAHRHLSGTQRSLELALTGRLLPELEKEILSMTKIDAWKRP